MDPKTSFIMKFQCMVIRVGLIYEVLKSQASTVL